MESRRSSPSHDIPQNHLSLVQAMERQRMMAAMRERVGGELATRLQLIGVRQVGRIGVPAAQHEAHPLLRPGPIAAGLQRGKGGRRAGLGGDPARVPERLPRAHDLVVADRDHVVDEALGDVQPDRADPGGAERVGRDPADLDVDRLAGSQRRRQRGAAVPVPPRSPWRPTRVPGRDAPDQAGAPDGDDDRSDRRSLVVELRRDRALARHHRRLVVGVHQDRAGVERPLLARRVGIGVETVDDVHGRAVDRIRSIFMAGDVAGTKISAG